MLEEYYRHKEKFRKTHQALGCWECCCVIQPGDDIWVKDDHVYCSAECLASHCDGYQLTFQMDDVDDDGYRDMFSTTDNHDA